MPDEKNVKTPCSLEWVFKKHFLVMLLMLWIYDLTSKVKS